MLSGAAAEAACALPRVARSVLHDAVAAAASALGVDPALAVVLTSAPLSCGAIYYVPLANDVRGIGYVHSDAREVFDDTPGAALEGIAFLNDWPYWRDRSEELASAFNHEVGHRWGARVHVRAPDLEPAALLGRERNHWSYFLSSDGSPHEGNVWLPAASGYVSQTPRFATEFSALDLYLMGVATAAEVGPFTLLTQPSAAGSDCTGAPLSAGSPPQRCAPLELQADAALLSVDDVIAAEGPRVPAARAEAVSLDVLVLVLETPNEPLGVEGCRELASALDARLVGFEQATWGRVALVNALGAGDSCDQVAAGAEASAEVLEAAPRGAAPVGCSLGDRGVPLPLAPLGLLIASFYRRRRRAPARA